MIYTCSVCQRPVTVVDAETPPVRECEHTDAAIIAHCDAICYGESEISDGPEIPEPQVI